MQDGGLPAGEEVVGGNLDCGPGGTQRTAQKLLDENPRKYFKCLADCLNLMSTHRFPEQLPFDLAPADQAASTTYTTSREKCSSCGGEFSHLETVPATRITAVSHTHHNGEPVASAASVWLRRSTTFNADTPSFA